MKPNHAGLAMFAAGCCVVFGCSGISETVSSQSRRNWMDVDPSAITAAELEPDTKISPGTHLAAGRLHEMRGSLHKAAQQYELSLAGDPKHVGAMNRLATVYARMGKFDNAQRSLERAVKLRPSVALLRNNLGYVYLCGKDWSEAEEEFREALRLNARFKRARVNLAIALARQERLDDALDEFRAVLPEPDALYNLGLVLRGMKHYRDAADAFELVLEEDDQFVAAQRQLEELSGRIDGEARRPAKRDVPSWATLAAGRNTAPPKTQPAPVTESTSVPVVVSEAAFETVAVDAQPHTPVDNIVEEPAAVAPVTVAVAPITRAESATTEIIEAIPSPVADVPVGVNIIDAAPQLESDAPSLVRLSSAVSSDVAPLLYALEEHARAAVSDGVRVVIDPTGFSPNTVQIAELAPADMTPAGAVDVVVDDAQTVEVYVESLTGAEVAEEIAAAAEDIPHAILVDTVSESAETGAGEDAGEQLPEAVEVVEDIADAPGDVSAVPAAIAVRRPKSGDPNELLPVDDSGHFAFKLGEVDVYNP